MTNEEETRRRAIKDTEKDLERLEKIKEILTEALEYLKTGASLLDFETKFDKKLDEAESLMEAVYFGNHGTEGET